MRTPASAVLSWIERAGVPAMPIPLPMAMWYLVWQPSIADEALAERTALGCLERLEHVAG